MLSWLNWLVYKPNFQIPFREVLAKSRACPKISKNVVTKNLFTYFISAQVHHTKSAPPILTSFSQKTQRHHEPTHLHGLHSFRVDGRSIIIGDFCRSSPDRVSSKQWDDDDFANVCNVLRVLCLDLARCPLHHDGTNVSVLKSIFVRFVWRSFRINAH